MDFCKEYQLSNGRIWNEKEYRYNDFLPIFWTLARQKAYFICTVTDDAGNWRCFEIDVKWQLKANAVEFFENLIKTTQNGTVKITAI